MYLFIFFYEACLLLLKTFGCFMHPSFTYRCTDMYAYTKTSTINTSCLYEQERYLHGYWINITGNQWHYRSKEQTGANEMAQWVKETATRPNKLSLVPGPHIAERTNDCDLCSNVQCAHAHIHKYILIFSNIKFLLVIWEFHITHPNHT